MNTIREAIAKEVMRLGGEIAGLEETAGFLPDGLLAVEADDVKLWSRRWFHIVDETHPSLCTDLMALGLKRLGSGRKKVMKRGMKAGFYLPGDDHFFVDVVRPDKRCKKARVLVTEERTIVLCGELPENYELIEVLGE